MLLRPAIFAFFCVVVFPSMSIQDPLRKTVTYKDCGSVFGTVKSVEIDPCTAEPCIFIKNKNVSVIINFTSKEAAATVTSKVHGIIGGIPIPFPIPQPDACKDSGLSCPLVSGQNYNFTQKLEVKPEYPSLKLVVKWELQDKAGKDIVCIEVPAQIQ